MKALILAGGKGTRLYPITLYMPKQLIMINGYPVIYYIMAHCVKNGISEFIICTDSCQRKHFVNALWDISRFGVHIEYSIAPKTFGTAGRVLHAKKLIKNKDNFVVYYGDIITEFNLNSMIHFHETKVAQDNCIGTIAMTSNSPVAFGGGFMDSKGKMNSFKEKPKISEISNFLINIGIGAYNSQIFKYCAPEADLAGDAIPLAIKNGESVYGFMVDEPFYDIGTFACIETVSKKLHKIPLNLAVKSVK
jgi:NDP-sugar pyrophosphorylase family protein